RFLPLPSKNSLEDVRHVIHIINWVIPANHQVARFQSGFWLFLLDLNCSGPYFRGHCLRHVTKHKRGKPPCPERAAEWKSEGRGPSAFGVRTSDFPTGPQAAH